MEVFVSWAKPTSRAVAEALRDWLPDVVQSVRPWMSSADIGAGERWSAKIAEALATSKIGIICVTAENQREPWLLFEAGALAKTLENTRVCPFLINLKPQDLAAGPLTQFQAKEANEAGTFELVSTINKALGAEALAEDRLRRLFERSWADLKAKLECLPSSANITHRTSDEMLGEVLETVRSISRRVPEPPPEPSPEQIARHRRLNRASFVRHLLRRALPDFQKYMPQLSRAMLTMTEDELDMLRLQLRDCDARTAESIVTRLIGGPAGNDGQADLNADGSTK
jgi:hypothetical protein